MKSELKTAEKTLECLKKHPEKRFTAREIAEWIFKKYPEECSKKQATSNAKRYSVKSDEGLITQIARDVSSLRFDLQKHNPEIKVIEDSPKKYYFSNRTDAEEVEDAEKGKSSPTPETDTSALTEHDLYPKLSEFLRLELEVHSKRIDEKRSSNSHGAGGNRWLHPDLVGMEDLSKDWHNEIKGCVKECADKQTKLWSFEVKIKINRTNVRECFYQAVSNSSWANYGYLVAGEIRSEAMKELRMLASLHGIGFIRLNADNPSESEIMIPAKERGDVNWDMANRLAKENPDFMQYIKEIRKFYQTGDIHESNWDYKEDEEL